MLMCFHDKHYFFAEFGFNRVTDTQIEVVGWITEIGIQNKNTKVLFCVHIIKNCDMTLRLDERYSSKT